MDGVTTDDAWLSPAARDDGGVAGLAACGREDAFGQMHAGNVFRARLLAHQQDRVFGVRVMMLDGRNGGEDDLAAGRSRTGRDPLRNGIAAWPWDRAGAREDG